MQINQKTAFQFIFMLIECSKLIVEHQLSTVYAEHPVNSFFSFKSKFAQQMITKLANTFGELADDNLTKH